MDMIVKASQYVYVRWMGRDMDGWMDGMGEWMDGLTGT